MLAKHKHSRLTGGRYQISSDKPQHSGVDMQSVTRRGTLWQRQSASLRDLLFLASG